MMDIKTVDHFFPFYFHLPIFYNMPVYIHIIVYSCESGFRC